MDDGWMDWMDGRMDGWMCKIPSFLLYTCKHPQLYCFLTGQLSQSAWPKGPAGNQLYMYCGYIVHQVSQDISIVLNTVPLVVETILFQHSGNKEKIVQTQKHCNNITPKKPVLFKRNCPRLTVQKFMHCSSYCASITANLHCRLVVQYCWCRVSCGQTLQWLSNPAELRLTDLSTSCQSSFSSLVPCLGLRHCHHCCEHHHCHHPSCPHPCSHWWGSM